MVGDCRFDTTIPPRTLHLEASGRVSTRPVLLISAVVSGVGADAKVIFHDGQGTGDTKLLTLQAPSKYSCPVSFSMGKYFPNGMYIELTNATDYTDIDFYEGETPGENG